MGRANHCRIAGANIRRFFVYANS